MEYGKNYTIIGLGAKYHPTELLGVVVTPLLEEEGHLMGDLEEMGVDFPGQFLGAETWQGDFKVVAVPEGCYLEVGQWIPLGSVYLKEEGLKV